MYIPEAEYKLILENIPVLCVDLLITHKGKFLLLERDNEPAKGEYWFPGGRLYKFESIKEAAVRKAIEEVNLECSFHYIVSVEETIFRKTGDMSTDVHTVNIVCKLTVNNIENIKIDDLHKNYLWVDYDHITDFNLHLAVLNPLRIEYNNNLVTSNKK